MHKDDSPLASYIAENMMVRLEFLTLQPQVIVDVSGDETGYTKILLEKKYKNAEIFTASDKNILPFEKNSVDFIFANLTISWNPDWKNFLLESRRVLKPGGLLIFSCLGLDTLAFIQEKIPTLFDMHTIGDALIDAKLADPILEVEHITFQYREAKKFLSELKLNRVISKDVSIPSNLLSAPYEIIYGHAFGPDSKVDFVADENGIVKIPLSHLKRSQK